MAMAARAQTKPAAAQATDEATRENQAAYDAIAPLYARRNADQERWFTELREAFASRLPPAADIADLGCGAGGYAALFARAGHRVIGIDRSAGMLEFAARRLPGRVAQADMRRLPLADQRVDGVWCCAALLHVPYGDTAAALAEMRRVLRPAGCLALVTAAGDGARLEAVPYAPREQRWYFYRQPGELTERLLAARLAVISMDEQATSRRWTIILARAV